MNTSLFPRFKPIFLLTCLSFFPLHGYADGNDWHFSGFGTLGVSWFSNQQADFAVNVAPNGPGRTRDLDVSLDSRLGFQVDYALFESTTLTAQAVTEKNPDKTMTPYLSLASLRHEFDNGLIFRIGRLQPTAYLAAEYRLANFANPWVRTPQTVYGLWPLVAQEAMDMTYPLRTDYGTFTGWAGVHTLDVDAPRSNAGGTDPIHVRNGHYLGLKWQQGAWQAKFSWSRNELTYRSPAIQGALAALSLFDSKAAQKLTIDHAPINLFSLGASYEDGDWFMMAEWAKRASESALSSAWGGYLTLGKHFGEALPYLTLGRRHTFGAHLSSRDKTANYIIEAIFAGQNYSEWTGAIGVSYPLLETALLKFQTDWIAPDTNSYGPYTNNDPVHYQLKNPSIDTLISLNLDFIF